MKKYALICLLAALSWVAGAQTKEQKDAHYTISISFFGTHFHSFFIPFSRNT